MLNAILLALQASTSHGNAGVAEQMTTRNLWLLPCRHLVVAGGVACNQHIRSQLSEVADKAQLQLVLPPPKWCTDNGAMVAWAGIER
jgi:tRNA A37 threonylcarbamoyltransferase TsaD